MVLMNENILSASLAPDMAFKDGQLYKFGPQRVKRVLDLFPGHDIQVGMAVRNPAGFLVVGSPRAGSLPTISTPSGRPNSRQNEARLGKSTPRNPRAAGQLVDGNLMRPIVQ